MQCRALESSKLVAVSADTLLSELKLLKAGYLAPLVRQRTGNTWFGMLIQYFHFNRLD